MARRCQQHGPEGPESGQAFGSDIFIQGSQSISFSPASGSTLNIGDVIADQAGSGGSGLGSLSLLGGGTVVLSPLPTFMLTAPASRQPTPSIWLHQAPRDQGRSPS